MENYKNLPEYHKLNDCLLRLHDFQKIHQREFETITHWGELHKSKKVFYDELGEEHKKEHDLLYKELGEANVEYLKIVKPEII